MHDKAGGFVEQKVDPLEHARVPAKARYHQLAGEAKGYKQKAIEDGIAPRKAGLFPPDDPFLLKLLETEGLFPFEKHLSGAESPYEALKRGGWATGDAAASNGCDLRLFYKEKEADPFCDDDPDEHGTVIGAARLGDKAAIGNGLWTTAHGGAIETVLDESTAELAKFEFAPLCTTAEASFKFKKSVPLHTTLQIDCKVKKIQGLKCWVTGTITLPGSSTILASCEAQLANMAPMLKAQFQG